MTAKRGDEVGSTATTNDIVLSAAVALPTKVRNYIAHPDMLPTHLKAAVPLPRLKERSTVTFGYFYVVSPD